MPQCRMAPVNLYILAENTQSITFAPLPHPHQIKKNQGM